MSNFAIVIEKANSNYSAYCPDLPGVIATGRTTEEIIQRMKDAITSHIQELKEDKITIPEPTTQVATIEVTI